MTNRNSKTHALVDANQMRPKAKMWKRRNKANAKGRSIARHTAMRDALAKGNA